MAGNSIDSGGTNNPAPFHTWGRGPGNGLRFEAFVSGSGMTLDQLTNSPTYPEHPFIRTNLYAFDSRVAFPGDSYGNFGTRTRGVFIPPVSGNWIFFLRSADRSTVFLNRTGLDAASASPIVAETTWADGDWDKLLSSPISLQAGQAYYIEALHQGSDVADPFSEFIKVAVRLQGSGLPPLGIPNSVVDTNAITGAAIGFPFAPRDLGGPLTITDQPADITADEGQRVTFTVGATSPYGLPMSFRWYKNGHLIDGANEPILTLVSSLADNGARFTAEASTIGSTTLSREATLMVAPDTTPPRVVAVHGSYRLDQLIVSCSEPMRASHVQDSFNYVLEDGRWVTAANVDATGTNVILTLNAPLPPGAVLELTVQDVADLANSPNLIDPNPTVARAQAWVISRGFALEQLYFNIGTDLTIANLVSNPKYPNAPDRVNWKSTLEGTPDAYDGHGTRLTGWIQPPIDGDLLPDVWEAAHGRPRRPQRNSRRMAE